MDEQEKRELVKAINEIRKGLGLQEYDAAYLLGLSKEELDKLYKRQFSLRKEYKKPEVKREFKLNLKTGLLIGVSVIVLLYTQFIWKLLSKQAEGISSISPLKPGFEEITPLEEGFTIDYTSNTEQNLSLFTLSNLGNKTIENFIVEVDGQETDYQIVKGSLPLSFGESIEFTIFNVCDKEHLIIVTVKNQNRTIVVNPGICEEYQKR